MKKHKGLKTAFLGFLMVTLLSGCGNRGSDSAFFPIYIHKDDQITDGTARQILQHNKLGQALHQW
jgi:hypothetical protein